MVYKSGKCGQALALDSMPGYNWGIYGDDIPTLPNYTTPEEASQDFASCENSKKIKARGRKSEYPAVWAAYEYSTEGTNAGDWCLPAAGIFTLIKNKSAIVTGLMRAGGSLNLDAVWSSTEVNNYAAWRSLLINNYGLEESYLEKKLDYSVRPVIEF